MFNPFKKKTFVDEFARSVQGRFNKASEKAWRSGWHEFGSSKRVIRIEYSDPNLTKEVKNISRHLNEISLTAVDREGIKQAQQRVHKKFEKELNEGKIGGTGGGGVEGFFSVADFALGVIFQWSIKHVIDDLDKRAWETLKAGLVSIYKKTSQNDKENKGVVIVAASMPHEHDVPTIAFIFPSNTPLQDFSEQLDQIGELAKGVISASEKEETKFIHEFTFDPSSKKWHLKNRDNF